MHAAPDQLRNLKVLIVEDNDDDEALMVAALRRAGIRPIVRRVRTEPEFRAALQEPADAILSDFTLPGFGARRVLDICAELRVDIPCIVVTGSISEEVAVDCMKRGAADYLLKDRLARLGSALLQAVNARAVRNLKMHAERTRDAAMRELDHRVRNNLAVVVGLAELTVRSCPSLAAFSPVFMGRVRALATVHDALGEHQWLHVDLRSLVLRLVSPHAAPSRGTLEVNGDPIPIAARAVQPLGLALHELARSAIEHGAWSSTNGQVRISWTAAPDALDLVWEEHSPAHADAGATSAEALFLVDELIRHETNGTVVAAALPDGRVVRISCPLTFPADVQQPPTAAK
jgi:two-component sensor histidine kinase